MFLDDGTNCSLPDALRRISRHREPSRNEMRSPLSQLPVGSYRSRMASASSFTFRPCFVPLRYHGKFAQAVQGNLSSFGVLSLLGAVLVHIAKYERLAWYQTPNSDDIWATSIQKTLQAWETTWRQHSHATPNPYSETHGPLMADAVPLLNTAYFHIYAPRALRWIKETLMTSVRRPETSREEFNAIMMPQPDSEREGLFRAATHAAHSCSSGPGWDIISLLALHASI
jgi:hypothetical protein